MTTQGKLQTRMQMSGCISLPQRLYKDFFKGTRKVLSTKAGSQFSQCYKNTQNSACAVIFFTDSQSWQKRKEKEDGGMKKSRMKKNSAVIIKVETDRLRTSWDVKDNGNDSNGQMESFKTSELMYCLAQLIYNAHFCGLQQTRNNVRWKHLGIEK